ATLTGYAYETVPDQGLLSGQKRDKKSDLESENLTAPDEATPTSTTPTQPAQQPATLGMLAIGSPALSAWRRNVGGN
ncbi:MAG: hypothetical protein WBW01_07280, partial [Terriglobales bacterium]